MKKTLWSIFAIVGLASTVAFLDAQPLGDSQPSRAAAIIKALPKKVHDAQFSDDATLAALRECEETALELRNRAAWIGDRLKSQSPAVKIQALRTMIAIGDSRFVARALTAIDDPFDDVKAQAAHTLRQLPHRRDAIPILTELSKHKKPEVRHAAVAALGKFAQSFREAIPPVVAALTDDEEYVVNNVKHSVQKTALNALRDLGSQANAAVPQIVRIIENAPDKSTQHVALRSLAYIAPTEPIIIQTTKQWMDEKNNPQRRFEGVAVLQTIEHHAAPAVPDLLVVFQKTDVQDPVLANRIKHTVLHTLQRIGPGAKDALPILTPMVRETQDRLFREELEKTIRAIRQEK